MTTGAKNTAWSTFAELAIDALASTGRQFTVDEVHLVVQHLTDIEPNDNKAMGGAVTTAQKRGMIAALPQWLASTRVTDRALRAWVGTGMVPEPIPTEDVLVAAFAALDSVAGTRTQQLLAAMRQAQAGRVE